MFFPPPDLAKHNSFWNGALRLSYLAAGSAAPLWHSLFSSNNLFSELALPQSLQRTCQIASPDEASPLPPTTTFFLLSIILEFVRKCKFLCSWWKFEWVMPTRKYKRWGAQAIYTEKTSNIYSRSHSGHPEGGIHCEIQLPDFVQLLPGRPINFPPILHVEPLYKAAIMSLPKAEPVLPFR